jgi:hypothetical protein
MRVVGPLVAIATPAAILVAAQAFANPSVGPPSTPQGRWVLVMLAGGLVGVGLVALGARRASRKPWMGPRRLLLLYVGVVALVYGVASLTGGWLGTPPWWSHHEPVPDLIGIYVDRPRVAREWVSGGLVLLGLGLLLQLWTRGARRPPTGP